MKRTLPHLTRTVAAYIATALGITLAASACSPQIDEPPLSSARCADLGGRVIGDPGDGRVHRPDFLCLNGHTPLGPIEYPAGEPIAIEGAVCCPRDE